MRWKPLEDRELPRPVQFIVTMPVLVILAPLMVCLWLDGQFQKRFGPKAEWSPWFAWYPVRSDQGFGQSVWLETVERRSWYGNTEHRTLDEASTTTATSGIGGGE